MDHKSFSRKGGRARSPAKTAANRAKASAYWSSVRLGKLPAPRRPKVPPSPERVGYLLSEFCRRHGVVRLEAFGSIARGEARRGSDVDLLATVSGHPGLHFFSMEGEMASILGAPVHLLTRDSVIEMTNPYRRASILADAKEIYRG
jgi:predicted nucleotidyltransferase